MHLFAKNHADFEECCFDAQKFVDNCDFFKHNGDPNQAFERVWEAQTKDLDTNALADLIMHQSIEARTLVDSTFSCKR